MVEKLELNTDDVKASMKMIREALKVHKLDDEEQHRFDEVMAIMEGSGNGIDKKSDLYAVILSRDIGLIDKAQSKQLILHKDFKREN